MSEGDPFDLDRFVAAQDPVYATALGELRAGRKRSHWMWFVFPQLRSLGSSPTSRFYGIASIDEARAFLRHPVLGSRLVECTEAVLATKASSLHALFGSPDDLKFRSSMTLFATAAEAASSPFRRAIDRYCDGLPDDGTIRALHREGGTGGR